MNNLRNKAGFCGSIHGKSFEILLILLFTLGIIILTVNLILTEWEFKLSYYLFYIEIGLVALNGLCLICSIILRCWRSNGSVLNSNYSSSHCISIIILFLVIINLLGSIAEEVLFYFLYYFITYDRDKGIDETYLKMYKIYEKIMNNPEEEEESRILSEDDDDKKMQTKIDILKILPWISFSLNIFFQICGIIFIVLLINRIKHKSDYGIPADALTQNGSTYQNGTATNRNSVNIGNSKSQVMPGEKRKSKKGNKKKKAKKNNKSGGKEIFSNAESDQVEINKKGRKKKRRMRRSKSKDKKK